MRFSRIQFTPDLMPSDVTGSSIWNQRDGDFEFRPGPIFTNLLLADEINRAPPKTQAALLEAMQERQATIEGDDASVRAAVPRDRDAEPDRVRGDVPAPRGAARPLPPAHGVRLPEPRGRGGRARASHRPRSPTTSSCAPSSTARRCWRCRVPSSACTSPTSVREYCVDLVIATRAAPSCAVGASPRGSLALLKLARCRAALQGRDFVAPGRRQGRRRAGARAPARTPPGAVGAAHLGRGRRPGGARDACRRQARRGRLGRRSARDAHRGARGSSGTRRSRPSGSSARSPSAGPSSRSSPHRSRSSSSSARGPRAIPRSSSSWRSPTRGRSRAAISTCWSRSEPEGRSIGSSCSSSSHDTSRS